MPQSPGAIGVKLHSERVQLFGGKTIGQKNSVKKFKLFTGTISRKPCNGAMISGSADDNAADLKKTVAGFRGKKSQKQI